MNSKSYPLPENSPRQSQKASEEEEHQFLSLVAHNSSPEFSLGLSSSGYLTGNNFELEKQEELLNLSSQIWEKRGETKKGRKPKNSKEERKHNSKVNDNIIRTIKRWFSKYIICFLNKVKRKERIPNNKFEFFNISGKENGNINVKYMRENFIGKPIKVFLMKGGVSNKVGDHRKNGYIEKLEYYNNYFLVKPLSITFDTYFNQFLYNENKELEEKYQPIIKEMETFSFNAVLDKKKCNEEEKKAYRNGGKKFLNYFKSGQCRNKKKKKKEDNS